MTSMTPPQNVDPNDSLISITPSSASRPARDRKRTEKGKEIDIVNSSPSVKSSLITKSSPLAKKSPKTPKAKDSRVAKKKSKLLDQSNPFANTSPVSVREAICQAPPPPPPPPPTPIPALPGRPSPSHLPSPSQDSLSQFNMVESVNPAPDAAAGGPGKPYYDQQLSTLQKALRNKAQLESKLARTRDNIYMKEGEYLDNTPNGNIIVGFENYTKGAAAGAGASRRRGNMADSNRIFSASDLTYNPNIESPAPSSTSTPVHTAPTPIATGSFLKAESASNHPTPTSASSANKTVTGAKKNKKSAGDDSETDTREVKKSRTGPGVPRK